MNIKLMVKMAEKYLEEKSTEDFLKNIIELENFEEHGPYLIEVGKKSNLPLPIYHIILGTVFDVTSSNELTDYYVFNTLLNILIKEWEVKAINTVSKAIPYAEKERQLYISYAQIINNKLKELEFDLSEVKKVKAI